MPETESPSLAIKARHLLDRVDLDRPELQAVRQAPDPAAALVRHLSQRNIGRFRFEYDRKPALLEFLLANYEAWRQFDRADADRVASLSIEQAQRPRALGQVIRLGQAWWATGDPSFGAAFQRFYQSVPTGRMFNWDAFNGSQGVHELNAWFLLRDCPGFSADGRLAFLDHLVAITDFAWDDATSQWSLSSLGPEGHNWWLHGMHVLPPIGCLFPELKRASFFLRTGMGVVEEHLRAHYRSDGGARELTPSYNQGSVTCLWDFYLVAQRNGYRLSSEFESRLLRATHFLLRLGTPAGCVPLYGDSHQSPGGLVLLAAQGAALAGDGECKAYAQRWRRLRPGVRGEADDAIPEEAFWWVGLEGARTYADTTAARLESRSVLMRSSGFAALRSSAEVNASYLAMTAAERGPIVTSHGHNDIFSLEVWADGTRFIGSQSFAPYGTSKGRMYDQCTEAHTCLTVKGEEQTPVVSEWRWAQQLRPAVTRWISAPTHDFLHGVHEGFYHWPDRAVLHARKVFFRKPSGACDLGYWIVMDWVESNRPRDYAIYFHGCLPATERDTRATFGAAGQTQLHLIPPEGDGLRLSRVEHDARRAYLNELKLKADDVPCLVYEQSAESHCFVWVLAPVRHGEVPPSVRRLPVSLNGRDATAAQCTAVELRWPAHTESLCVSHRPFDMQMEYAGRSPWGVIAGNVDGCQIVHTAAEGAVGF